MAVIKVTCNATFSDLFTVKIKYIWQEKGTWCGK